MFSAIELFPHAATHLFPSKSLYREQFCGNRGFPMQRYTLFG